MDVQKEISLRNAISYCIENNDANTATNRIMEFIRDEKEAINFIQCCETLNDKKAIPFEEWKEQFRECKCNDIYYYKGNEYNLNEISSSYKEDYLTSL